MKTGAVVVVWRDQPETLEALASLGAMTPAPDHVICVAQECTERFLDALRATGGPLVVVAVGDNLGFAAAANLGMERAIEAGAAWVLLVNNDATVERRCLAACVGEAARTERAAVVGPAVRIMDRPEQLWFGGGLHHHWLAFTRHRGLRGPADPPPPSADVDYVSGCCALISAAAWAEVGPFREDFFLYYEDVEWCVRARRMGWRCRYLGETLCSHALGVSSDQRGSLGLSENTAYYLARNPLRFALDSSPWWLRCLRVAGVLGIWGAYNAGRLLQARSRAVLAAYLAGTADACRNRMGRRAAGPRGAQGLLPPG